MKKLEYPGKKRFAFAIIDDTDVATVANTKPVYDLLAELNMRATKTVWPVACPEGSKNYSTSQTLEDPDYLEYIKQLKAKGFEISWHSATMESSKRERIERALKRYHDEFGEYPRIHINHGHNQESLYWGDARIDNPLLKFAYHKISWMNHGFYSGHIENSPCWWGDLCQEHIMYARNLTFNDINTAKYNRSMPYHDKKRALVPWWFSSSDADNVDEFIDLIHPQNQKRLEDEGGFCIVATHFGKEFVVDGKLNEKFKSRIEMLANREGWYPNAGELLDWLKSQRARNTIPKLEWTKMQLFWARDLVIRKLRERRRKVIA